jgi:hypothetical protein
LWKYWCEVISNDSPYAHKVDWLYSREYVRDGRSYDVQLNNDQKNPMIVEIICELQSVDKNDPANGEANETQFSGD